MYNAEKTIIKALDSVKAQTVGYNAFEIIVVNDGSTDQSKISVERYKKKHTEVNIQIIDQPNSGVSKARNAGIKIAKGDYVALLDSDDEWLPQKTEKQMRFLGCTDLKIDFLATTRNNSKILFPYKVGNDNLAEVTFRKLLIRNEIQPSTVIFKRKIIENTGYFDDNQRYAEDLNYWMKISLKNRMYILNESLVIVGGGKRTFGVSGLSANLPAMEKGFIKNIKEMYSLKNINLMQYAALRVFYKVKYLLLQCRTMYYNLKKK